MQKIAINYSTFPYSYSACIRRAAGYCCIEYNVCQGVTNAFTLDVNAAILGLIDTLCTGDYIAISGEPFYSDILRTMLELLDTKVIF